MSAPVQLAEVLNQPDATVVQELRELLAMAESGEVTAFAMAAACPDGTTITGFQLAGGCTIADLYLSIERVKMSLLEYGEGE